MRGSIIKSGSVWIINFLNIIQHGDLAQAIVTCPTEILRIKFHAEKHGDVKIATDYIVEFARYIFFAENRWVLMIFICKNVILVRICSTLSLRIGPPSINHLHRSCTTVHRSGQTHQPELAVGTFIADHGDRPSSISGELAIRNVLIPIDYIRDAIVYFVEYLSGMRVDLHNVTLRRFLT